MKNICAIVLVIVLTVEFIECQFTPNFFPRWNNQGGRGFNDRNHRDHGEQEQHEGHDEHRQHEGHEGHDEHRQHEDHDGHRRFGGRRGHQFGNRRHDFSKNATLSRVNKMETFIDRFFDNAIANAKRRNSTDVQVFQQIRDTDLPLFFNTLRQKLSTGLGGGPNGTNVGTGDQTGVIQPAVINSNIA